MNAVDVDLDVHARSTRILRRIEHKFPGGTLSRAQLDVLPLYSEALGAIAARGRIDESSGVFIVECEIPPAGATIERVWSDFAPAGRYKLDARQLANFLTARPLRLQEVAA